MVMQRIEWIDAAKGIGILLIMLSHCYNFDGLLYFTSGYIPLFFILSGITFNPYSSSVSLRKRLKRLLYPNFVYAFIITFLFSIPHLVFNWGWAMLMCLHLAVYKFFDYFILMVGDLNINIYGWVFIKMSFAIIFVLFWKLFVDKYVMKYSISN